MEQGKLERHIGHYLDYYDHSAQAIDRVTAVRQFRDHVHELTEQRCIDQLEFDGLPDNVILFPNVWASSAPDPTS